MNRTDANEAFLPETVGELIVKPVQAASVAMQVGTVVNIASKDYRLPIVAADPSAAWVAEGGNIPDSDGELDELVCTPSKVAGLSIVSRELAEDSSPAAQQVIGDGLARDIARKVDAAFFADTTANGPDGLESLTMSTVSGDGANLDWAYEAISKAEGFGGQVTSFVTHPTTALALRTLKTDSTDSNMNLGWPGDLPGLVTSPHATEGVIYGLDARFAQVVVRDATRLDVDRSRYFESDQVAIRATMRVGFAFPHPLALVRVNVGTGS